MLSVLDLLDRKLKQVKRDYIHSDFSKTILYQESINQE